MTNAERVSISVAGRCSSSRVSTGLVVVVGVPEVSGEHLAEVGEELDVHGLVQPVCGTDGGRELGVAAPRLGHDGVDDVTGGELEQEEVQHHDRHDQDGAEQQPFDDCLCHGSERSGGSPALVRRHPKRMRPPRFLEWAHRLPGSGKRYPCGVFQ